MLFKPQHLTRINNVRIADPVEISQRAPIDVKAPGDLRQVFTALNAAGCGHTTGRAGRRAHRTNMTGYIPPGQAIIIYGMRELAKHAWEMLGLRLTSAQRSALKKYEDELIKWNKRINLTAIHETKKIRIKHFLDSLTCLKVMQDTPMEQVIDVGTGAGFPGLPLKIIYPPMQLTLVESVGKKADFCQHMVNILELEGVEILTERAEIVGAMPQHRARYDWALARAVAPLPVLAEYLLPFVKISGRVLAMKGESGPAEAHAADRAIHLLGGHLHQLIPVHLPGVEEDRYLVVIDKVAATPDRYPRRVGIPSKRPL